MRWAIFVYDFSANLINSNKNMNVLILYHTIIGLSLGDQCNNVYLQRTEIDKVAFNYTMTLTYVTNIVKYIRYLSTYIRYFVLKLCTCE